MNTFQRNQIQAETEELLHEAMMRIEHGYSRNAVWYFINDHVMNDYLTEELLDMAYERVDD